MNTTHSDRILKATRALRTSLVAVIANVDELSDLIERLPTIATPPVSAVAVSGSGALQLNRATYTVQWDHKSCFLGYTMAFRVLERLARRPNEYISTDRLLEELWVATRSSSTVRSTVCGLKAKLRAAGMRDLAEFIDGSNSGHYALMLPKE
ncbi:MAG: winged helix-turn-helix domain-containing protein [Phycisphaerales bacterium]